MAKPDQLRRRRRLKQKRKQEQASQADQHQGSANPENNQNSRRLIGAAVFVLACVILFIVGCQSERLPHSWSGDTMGTYYRVTLGYDQSFSTDEKVAIGLLLESELVAINQSMSTYIADSELSQWNQLAPGQCAVLSQPLFQVMELALDVARQSDGFFNPLVGPLVNAWGFGPIQSQGIPSDETLDALMVSTRLGLVKLDVATRELCKADAYNVQLDLSAIAKGFAVDKLASVLRERGIEHFLVDIGGELYAHGLNSRKIQWQLAIEKPDQLQQGVQELVALSGQAIATSGDYRNFFEYQGKRYSHTIDPNTGYPVQHNMASVSVVAGSAALADAWATALLSAGPEKSKQWSMQYSLAIYIIQRDNNDNSRFGTWHSDDFQPFMVSH